MAFIIGLVTIVRRNLRSWLAVVSRLFPRLQFYPLGSRASCLASQRRSSVLSLYVGASLLKAIHQSLASVRAGRQQRTSIGPCEWPRLRWWRLCSEQQHRLLLLSSIPLSLQQRLSSLPLSTSIWCVMAMVRFFCENWTPCPPQVLLVSLAIWFGGGLGIK